MRSEGHRSEGTEGYIRGPNEGKKNCDRNGTWGNRWNIGGSSIETPIDSGIGLSIRIDKFRVFINKTLSTDSLINQLLIKRASLEKKY